MASSKHHLTLLLVIFVLHCLSVHRNLYQQITAFYEDNFPEVMKNILVVKGEVLPLCEL